VIPLSYFILHNLGSTSTVVSANTVNICQVHNLECLRFLFLKACPGTYNSYYYIPSTNFSWSEQHNMLCVLYAIFCIGQSQHHTASNICVNYRELECQHISTIRQEPVVSYQNLDQALSRIFHTAKHPAR
jgi:hypothetical protein